MKDKPKKCKDCPTTSKRKATYPGPRCHTHHVARKKAQKARRDAKRDLEVYGLGEGEYDALKAFQAGSCAICQRAKGITKRLAVDHNHDTGAVRGLLCTTCNHTLLGRYDLEALERAIDYLNDPPYETMKRRDELFDPLEPDYVDTWQEWMMM